MAEKLSDVQKAALDFLIAYKQHDDSFIDTMADIANDFANATDKVTDAAQQAVTMAVNYAKNNPAGAAGAGANALARVAQVTEAMGEGGLEAMEKPLPGAAGGQGISLQDLIRARHMGRHNKH